MPPLSVVQFLAIDDLILLMIIGGAGGAGGTA